MKLHICKPRQKFRDQYLSHVRQGSSETATELTICIEDLVLQYKWPDGQTECCCIDLCYHATKFYEVRQFIQTETAKKEVSLT